MPKFTTITHINAPVDRVFMALTAFENAADFISGIERVEMLTDGPVGLGTRFRETRIMFKREATEEMEVSAWEPNRHYALGCSSCGCEYLSTFDFEADGDGTVVTMTFDTRPISFFARLMAPFGRLMAGMVRKCVAKDMEDARRHIEGGERAEALA